MVREIKETNTDSKDEGLRVLARIIARIYIRDVRDKTAMETGKQLQKEQKNSGKTA